MAVNEFVVSDQLKDRVSEIAGKYQTGGIWLARKYVKRWDFIFGERARLTGTPTQFDINENFALFVENSEKISNDWELLKGELETFLG